MNPTRNNIWMTGNGSSLHELGQRQANNSSNIFNQSINQSITFL